MKKPAAKPASAMTLAELTVEVTAFRTWYEFAQSMDAGYAPTLRPAAGRGKRVAEWNAKVERLASMLEGLGWNVWRGTN